MSKVYIIGLRLNKLEFCYSVLIYPGRIIDFQSV